MQKIRIKWRGETMPPGNMEDAELIVLADIARNLGSLDKPSDLVYHFVPLGDSYEGPSVTVWGEADDDEHFYCQYEPETEWVSMSEGQADD